MTDPNATAPGTPVDPLDPADPAGPLQGDIVEAVLNETEATDARQRELDEAKDKYLRLAAEFDNFRRRSIKERQEAGWRAQGDMIRSFLDVLDDLTRFGALDPAATDSKTVVDGVALVERKLMKELAGFGLEVVDPTGQPFDPALHEAMTTTPAGSEEEDHLVAMCFQPGYVINGLVLRPARVVVKQWTPA